MSNWIKGKVGDLLQGLESGVSVNGHDRAPMPDECSVLKVSSVTYGIFNSDSAKPIKEKDAGRAKCNPRKGQIIISRSNTPELVGASALVDQDYPHRYLSDKLWQTVPRPNIQLCTKWLAFVLSSPEVRYKLSQLATGSSNSMKNITKDELLSLPILIPPCSEQKIISETLQTWDTAIEKTEALIDAKERQFGWLVRNIYNNLEKSEQKVQPLSLYMNTTLHIHGNIDATIAAVGKRGIRDRAEIYSKELSKYYSKNKLVYKNEIAFGLASDCIVYGVNLTDNIYSVSPAYKTFNIHGCNSTFLKYLLDHYNSKLSLKYLITSARQGKSVDFDGLLNEKFIFPPVEKQEHIAHTLNTAQQEITLLKKLADQYRTQKRGLMQKLLSGEWHIKNKEAQSG